jgi:HD-like signal output (HDOD) protein
LYDKPDLATLRRLRTLSQFSDEQLIKLSGKLSIQTARKETRLIEVGCSEQFNLYLLEGCVCITARDGEKKHYQSNPNDELLPIAKIRPSLYNVDVTLTAKYLRIDPNQLTEFAQKVIEKKYENFEVTTIMQSREENELTMQLFRDMTSDNVNLPSLPNVAHRIQQAFMTDNVDADTISRIIQSDPAITAKLIMVANSPLYLGRGNTESLNQAVVRLGLETTQQLVFTYALKELFKSKSVLIKKRMQALWQHSRKVASLSKVLAQLTTSIDPEQAQLAGLIHDLGEIAILQYAEDHTSLFDDEEKLLQVIKNLRPQITSMLLSKWNFGGEFVSVGEESEAWFRNPSNEPDLCDLIMIAQYHSMIGTPEMAQLPPISKLPAFSKLGMSELTPAQILAFMAESKAEIEQIDALLGGV